MTTKLGILMVALLLVFSAHALPGDIDGDGIADGVDNCPNIANAGQEDVDLDDIGNPCDDDHTTHGVIRNKIVDIQFTLANKIQSYDQEQAVLAFAPLEDDAAAVDKLRLLLVDVIQMGLEIAQTKDEVVATGSQALLAHFNDIEPEVTRANFEVDIRDAITNWENDDPDLDGVLNKDDNCPAADNLDQLDTDGDSIGNACDNEPNDGPLADEDNDGVQNAQDQCPNTPAGEAVNAVGCAASQLDTDNDGIADGVDNCVAHANADQADADGDGIGDACDGVAEQPAEDPGVCGAFTAQADEMRLKYREYDDRYDSKKRRYQKALDEDDSSDERRYERDLRDIDDDLDNLDEDVEDLIQDVEDSDVCVGADRSLILDRLEDTEDDIARLRNRIKNLLDEDDDRPVVNYNSYVPPPQPVVQQPAPTQIVFEPFEFPTQQEPVVQERSGWEDMRVYAWIAAGIVIFFALIVFFIAVLVKK